jgi:Fur family transcriptional regulator, ferric uptake regulator
MATWREVTLGSLRRQGYRSGGARQAVVDLLADEDCCLTAQEIFDRLRANDRRVGIASVYRTLELLVDKGFVQKLDIGAGTARYEQAHPGGDHHHHIVCDHCGKVEAFADPRLERALHRVETSTGYAIAGHDVVLRGDCGDCRI